MSRVAALVAVAIMVVATLTACGRSPYCKAIDEHQETLNTLGQDKTNAAYRKYARAYRAVADVAPEGIRNDWVKLADVTQGVLRALGKAGIKLEQVQSTYAKLPVDDRESVKNAVDAFNNTTHEREAVVKNAKKECEISLS